MKVTVGLNSVYYALITEDANGDETYGTPTKLAPAISAEITFETASESLYADDMVWVTVSELTSGTISLGTADIAPAVEAALLNATIDGNAVTVTSSDDVSAYIALGFKSKCAKGGYQFNWLYRVKFDIPGTSYETKGDSISFQTPTLEGVFEPRHKVAVDGKHPMRVKITDPEATAGAGALPVTQAWFNEVYEPVATTNN